MMPLRESDPSRGQKKIYLDRNLEIIFAITLIAALGVSSITLAFPKIVQELNLPPPDIGLLITVFTLPGVLLTPLLGILADRLGRKKVLVPSLMLFGIAGGACSFVNEFSPLLALRFLQGIGAASLGALNVTVIGDLYSSRERATVMGYNASILSIGTTFYPIIGGALAIVGWSYPFLLSFIAIPVGLLVLFSLKNPEPKDRVGLKEYLSRAWKSINNRQAIGLFAASCITFIILYGVYLTYFPLLIGLSFNASPFIIGVIMASASLTTAATASQMGRLSRLYSERTLIKAAAALYALALAIIPFIPNLWLFLIPTLLLGFAQGVNNPSIQTLLADLAPMEHRAAFMSIYGMVLRLGQTLGPLLMGVVFVALRMTGVFYVGVGFAAAMLVIVALTIKRSQPHS